MNEDDIFKKFINYIDENSDNNGYIKAINSAFFPVVGDEIVLRKVSYKNDNYRELKIYFNSTGKIENLSLKRLNEICMFLYDLKFLERIKAQGWLFLRYQIPELFPND